MRVWAPLGDASTVVHYYDMMMDEYNHGNVKARPNTLSFDLMLKAWANSRDTPHTEDHAQQILETMKRLQREESWDTTPDFYTYVYMVKYYCFQASRTENSKDNNTSSNGTIDYIQRAEHILQEWESLHRQKLLSDGPSIRPYEALLKLWDRSSHPQKEKRIAELRRIIRSFHNMSGQDKRVE
jgi:hypothetical protein